MLGRKKSWFNSWVYLFLILVTLTILFPTIWVTYTAFKPQKDILKNIFSLPKSMYLENFSQVWIKNAFGKYFLNSAFVTLCSVGGLMIFISSMAYAFAFLDFKWKKTLFMYALLGQMIPAQIIIVANFKLMSFFRLIDTRAALILTYLSWIPFGVFFLRAFYLSIPKELREVAKVDGATELTIFLRIMLPLAKPAILVVAIFYFVWIWNDFLWPLVYINSVSKSTLTIGLMTFSGKYTSLWGQQAAAISTVFWGPLIFYLIFHKQFIKGVLEGGLKA